MCLSPPSPRELKPHPRARGPECIRNGSEPSLRSSLGPAGEPGFHFPLHRRTVTGPREDVLGSPARAPAAHPALCSRDALPLDTRERGLCQAQGLVSGPPPSPQGPERCPEGPLRTEAQPHSQGQSSTALRVSHGGPSLREGQTLPPGGTGSWCGIRTRIQCRALSTLVVSAPALTARLPGPRGSGRRAVYSLSSRANRVPRPRDAEKGRRPGCQSETLLGQRKGFPGKDHTQRSVRIAHDRLGLCLGFPWLPLYPGGGWPPAVANLCVAPVPLGLALQPFRLSPVWGSGHTMC